MSYITKQAAWILTLVGRATTKDNPSVVVQVRAQQTPLTSTCSRTSVERYGEVKEIKKHLKLYVVTLGFVDHNFTAPVNRCLYGNESYICCMCSNFEFPGFLFSSFSFVDS